MSVDEPEDLYPDVEIEVYQGFFIATKKSKDGDWNEDVFLPEPRPNEEPFLFVIMLTADQLVALSKILYERWAFVTGDDRDKEFYEACEYELKKRRDCAPFLHQHHIPSHSHSFHSNTGYLPGGAHTHTFRSTNPHGQIVDLPYPHDSPPRMPWLIAAS